MGAHNDKVSIMYRSDGVQITRAETLDGRCSAAVAAASTPMRMVHTHDGSRWEVWLMHVTIRDCLNLLENNPFASQPVQQIAGAFWRGPGGWCLLPLH